MPDCELNSPQFPDYCHTGGLIDEAYTQGVEVLGLNLSNPKLAKYQHQSFGLTAGANDRSSYIQLVPYDNVSIRTIPDFKVAAPINLGVKRVSQELISSCAASLYLKS